MSRIIDLIVSRNMGGASAPVGAVSGGGGGGTVYSPFVGADNATNGVQGLVPAPLAGEQDRFLSGDGTWVPISVDVPDFTGATPVDIGEHGLVPECAAGDQDKFLKGDGTWATPVDTVGGGSTTIVYTVGSNSYNDFTGGTALQDAINSAGGSASASTPVLIKVEPGTYDGFTLNNAHISIQGSGKDVTIIGGAGTVDITNGATGIISDMTISRNMDIPLSHTGTITFQDCKITVDCSISDGQGTYYFRRVNWTAGQFTFHRCTVNMEDVYGGIVNVNMNREGSSFTAKNCNFGPMACVLYPVVPPGPLVPTFLTLINCTFAGTFDLSPSATRLITAVIIGCNFASNFSANCGDFTQKSCIFNGAYAWNVPSLYAGSCRMSGSRITSTGTFGSTSGTGTAVILDSCQVYRVDIGGYAKVQMVNCFQNVDETPGNCPVTKGATSAVATYIVGGHYVGNFVVLANTSSLPNGIWYITGANIRDILMNVGYGSCRVSNSRIRYVAVDSGAGFSNVTLNNCTIDTTVEFVGGTANGGVIVTGCFFTSATNGVVGPAGAATNSVRTDGRNSGPSLSALTTGSSISLTTMTVG